MGKIAFIFPGQGSQVVGMGAALVQESTSAKEIFAKADKTLGFPLSTLCFEGPEEELTLTANTQPAILTTSIALLAALTEQLPDLKPDFTAGHSLGEYSALVAVGAMTFEDAVKTVRARGTFMEEAVPAGQGAMAAVLGMERHLVRTICEEVTATGHPVQLANLNCPGQLVISGSAQGVEKAGVTLKEQGAKRVKGLKVSGPFHSVLMAPAAERLAGVLDGVSIQDVSIPVIANVSARPMTEAGEIKRTLVEQVTSPVHWEDSVLFMIEQGVTTFIEIGPGKVLTGLVKKIATEGVQSFNIEDTKTLAALLERGVLC